MRRDWEDCWYSHPQASEGPKGDLHPDRTPARLSPENTLPRGWHPRVSRRRRPTPTREGGFGRDAGTGKLSAIYYRLRTGGFAASLGRSLRVALPHQPLSRLQARRVQPTHLSPMGAD